MAWAAKQPLLQERKDQKVAKEVKFGFSIDDEVNVMGRVVGFQGDRAIVELDGAEHMHEDQLLVQPGKIHRQRVWPCMKILLQVFCGYMDIWFLRETFLTNWADRKDAVKQRIEREEVMIWAKLEMEPWERSPRLIDWTFGKYLRCILSPSVYLYQKHETRINWVLGIVLSIMVLITVFGFANLKNIPDEMADNRGEEAFRRLEHAPITPVLLLLCTHLILMIFAGKQLHELFNETSRHLPFPLTYSMVVGKAFMIFRMFMAYSSGNLGRSIDYFVWQEGLITILHALLAGFVGDPSPHRGLGLPYSMQLAQSFGVILIIDSLKTFVMLVFWLYYKPGFIANCFNRLPSMAVMIVASLVIHTILDSIQLAVSTFTMFIGRIFAAVTIDHPTVKEKGGAALEGQAQNVARQFAGQWTTQNGYTVVFSLHLWTVWVPENLEEDRLFTFMTVRDFFWSSQAFLTIHIPEKAKPGVACSVLELRVHHPIYGVRSFDASSLTDGTIDLNLPCFPCATLQDNGKVLQFLDGVKWTKHRYFE